MGEAPNYLVLGYFGIAAAYAILCWVEMQGTYYVYGRPSAIFNGLIWPILLLVLLVWWARLAVAAIRRALPHNGDQGNG